jgi:hypothetical protein
MKKSTLRISIIISVFCMFMACKKEMSIENGGFSGTAQGELVDSLGNCKSSTVMGDYKVDTALVTTSNYALINVNFTAQGKYKIYTDTVNGMWFLDSGFAISTGAIVIKLKGYGKPILPKTTAFTIYFNNNVCTFEVSVNGSAVSSGGGSGSGSGGDYFPTTVGSSWTYQYIPKLGTIDTFRVTVAQSQIVRDTLSYAQFGTSLLDTFYFAKDGKGTYYSLSSVDFDYTFLFDSIPNFFISYPFLKESANVGDTWETNEYGTVKLVSGTTTEYGKAKAVFTVVSKNTTTYTIGGKTYSDVINMKREIKFIPNGTGAVYRTLLIGNSYYARNYGLIDQVFTTTPAQSVSLYRTPTIK